MGIARVGIGLAAAVLGLSASANADIFYSFDKDNYIAAPGGVVSVKVMLSFTGDDLTAINDPVTLNGLATGAVRLLRFGALPTEPARILSSADVVPNSADFDSGLPLIDWVSAADAGLWVDRDIAHDQGVFADASGNILLGTFKVTAGTVAGEATTFRAADYDPDTGSTQTTPFFGPGLDPSIGEALFTVTVVPEPLSVSLLAAPLLLLRRRRR